MNRWTLALVGLLLVLLAGCRTTPTDVPPGYVSVKSHRDRLLEAVSADGNRMVVKRHENPPEGTLEFWRDAVRNELVSGRGYVIIESGAVSGKDGRSAWEMLFRVVRPDGPYLYLVTVRVEGRYVIVAEAGGREASLTSDLNALRGVMR